MISQVSFVTSLKKVINRILGRYQEAKRYGQLYDVIKEIKAANIMEIGTWSGTRAAAMILAARQAAPGKKISYYGFDLFEDLTPDLYAQEISKYPPTMATVKAKLVQTGAQVELFKGDTNVSLSQLAVKLPKMDFIFIDGGHSKATIENDWRYSLEVLADKGVIIFDDYWPDRIDAGAKSLVDSLPRDRFNVQIMPITDIFKNPDHGRLTIQFARVSRR